MSTSKTIPLIIKVFIQEIIKNIRRLLSQNKLPFYEIEFNNNNDKYLHYKDLINTYYKNINTPI